MAGLSDTRSRYGWISIFLPWSAALLVIALFIKGESDGGIDQYGLIADHIALGLMALPLLGARVAWRTVSPAQTRLSPNHLLNFVATAVQWALLIVLALLIVTGPLLPWAAGRPLIVPDLLALPSPLPHLGLLHRALEEIHDVAAYLLVPLVGLHALGALKHIVVDRDAILSRMIRVKQS